MNTTNETQVTELDVNAMVAEQAQGIEEAKPHVVQQLNGGVTETTPDTTPEPEVSEVTEQTVVEGDSLDAVFDEPPELDHHNEPFNPDVHDKRKIINKDGHWRKKGGYHAHKTKVDSTPIEEDTISTVNEYQEPEATQEALPVVEATPQYTDKECMDAATETVDAFLLCGVMVGGPEWEPQRMNIEAAGQVHTIDERERLIDAVYKVYRKRGVVDIPPEVGLAIVGGTFVYSRFAQPITKSRWERFKNWMKIKILERRNGKTHTNSGDVGGGKDGSREASS